MSIVKLQASIGTYGTSPATLYGALETSTGVLLIGKAFAKLEPKKSDQHLKAGTTGCDDADIIFEDSELGQAIADWRTINGAGKLKLSGTAAPHNPEGRVQPTKVGGAGPIYEIGPDITSGQVAVLVLAWLAQKQVAHASASDFTALVHDQLYEMQIMGVSDPDLGNLRW